MTLLVKFNTTFVIIIFFINCCFGYYKKTHRYLGESLSGYLNENTDSSFIVNVNRLIHLSEFGISSIWADQVKKTREFAWSAPLHYIDIDKCGEKSLDLESYCNNRCIYTAILNMTNTLLDTKHTDIETSRQSLKFLIHFLQDLHQPLHLNAWFRGGNSWKISLKKGSRLINTNFHTLWDSYIPEYYIKTYNPLLQYVNNDLENTYINGILDYQRYLYKHIVKLSNTTCKITFTGQHEIDFDKYFAEHFDIIKLMFELYMEVSVKTLLFIFV